VGDDISGHEGFVHAFFGGLDHRHSFQRRRFAAFAFLLRAKYADFVAGGLLGVTLFVCYMLQLSGLALISSNRSAFITGLSVLVVPLLGLAMGKMPERKIIVAIAWPLPACLRYAGGRRLGRGDSLALGAHFVSAATSSCWNRYRARRRCAGVAAIQIITVALCALIWLHVREPSALPMRGLGAIFRRRRRHYCQFSVSGANRDRRQRCAASLGQRHAGANEAAVMYSFERPARNCRLFLVGRNDDWRRLGGVAAHDGMVVSQWTQQIKRAFARKKSEKYCTQK